MPRPERDLGCPVSRPVRTRPPPGAVPDDRRQDGWCGGPGWRQPQYEAFADEFLGHAEHSLFNAYYDRPACLDLLGDVTGKRVLDAACGPGLYAAELLRRGASVVGFDHSPRMIEICRERAGQGDFRVHDLGDPITWLPDASVDLALCALAIEYVEALQELRRVPAARRRAGAVPPASHR